MTTKEQFIAKHNILSPPNLQVSIKMIDFFKGVKPLLFKNNDYSMKKIRRPFLFWLTSLTDKEREGIDKS